MGNPGDNKNRAGADAALSYSLSLDQPPLLGYRRPCFDPRGRTSLRLFHRVKSPSDSVRRYRIRKPQLIVSSKNVQPIFFVVVFSIILPHDQIDDAGTNWPIKITEELQHVILRASFDFDLATVNLTFPERGLSNDSAEYHYFAIISISP